MSADKATGDRASEAVEGARDRGAHPREVTPQPRLQLVHDSEEALTLEQKERVLRVRGLVAYTVRKLAPRASPELSKELRAYGMLGAVKAVRGFKPSPDRRFPSYASPWIQGAIKDRLEKELRHTKLERAVSLVARAFLADEPDTFRIVFDSPDVNQGRLNGLIERLFEAMAIRVGSAPLSPEDALIEREDHERMQLVLEKALAMLSERARAVLALTVMREDEEALTQEQVGEKLGIHERSVRRILVDSLDALREALIAQGITMAPPERDW